MLEDVKKIITDRPTADFKFLHVEDVANAVITSLATPPNVLVSKKYLYRIKILHNVF